MCHFISLPELLNWPTEGNPAPLCHYTEGLLPTSSVRSLPKPLLLRIFTGQSFVAAPTPSPALCWSHVSWLPRPEKPRARTAREGETVCCDTHMPVRTRTHPLLPCPAWPFWTEWIRHGPGWDPLCWWPKPGRIQVEGLPATVSNLGPEGRSHADPSPG